MRVSSNMLLYVKKSIICQKKVKIKWMKKKIQNKSFPTQQYCLRLCRAKWHFGNTKNSVIWNSDFEKVPISMKECSKSQNWIVPDKALSVAEWRNKIVTYANGLKIVSQYQLLPPSGTVMVSTRATLAKLMHVQKVSNAAWPLFGTIMPSKLQ